MTGHMRLEDQSSCAGHEDQSVGGHRPSDLHTGLAADALVLIAADVLDDLERIRIATENRLRSLTREPTEGERGGWFGKGLDPDMPEVHRVEAILVGLRQLEHQAELDLRRAMRAHPLGGWVKRTIGVGEKQAARLLAAIGDPASRSLSQLRSYCGWGDAAAQRRRKGEKANWSSVARARAWLIAESCIKQRSSPYRKVYDAGREKYAEAQHSEFCVRCGPSGKPASPGSPLSDGHKHARALRLVAKAILKDLWLEARRTTLISIPTTTTSGGLDSAGGGQTSADNHTPPVVASSLGEVAA